MLRWLAITCGIVLFSVIVAGIVFIGVLHYFGRDLPDSQQLVDYELPVTTRVYAADGQLTKEYSVENRIFTPIHLIPKILQKAFLASEDKNFYQHPGIDPQGLVRALLNNIINRGKRPEGASTITQQVAKNFFLTNEVSIKRKAKEAILSLRIERALTKERILELYLNKIYFGYGAYGVTSAALNYFDKTLEDLSLAEIAYLAALPKAPGNYHPIHNYKAAVARRNYVLARMADAGFISNEDAQKAAVEPISIVNKTLKTYHSAEYYNEEVRRVLIDRYGMPGLYGGGLCVRTPLDLELQRYADDALRHGLELYDARRGWRGPLARIPKVTDDWAKQLSEIPNPGLGTGWRMALVLGSAGGGTEVGFTDGTKGTIPPGLRRASVGRGDVVPVEPMTEDDKGKPYPENTYKLQQIPKINGGFVVLDPHTGRVYAVAGGFSYEASEFNRATQAMRQTGSAFKPFIYLTAFENGLTPTDTILDSPVTIRVGQGLPPYTPTNYGGRYFGVITLRKALEKSANSAAVRLMSKVGVEKVAAMGERLGIADHMPRRFSIALGAQETTPLRMAGAYATVVNGGKKVTPTFIDSIQDRHGKTIFRHDGRLCPGCESEWSNQQVPVLQDTREQILNPMTAFQLVNVMEGVVQRGTAVRLKNFPHPLAAKTGTSTGFREAWFAAYTPNLVMICYMGMDDHSSLGGGSTGSSTALPVTKYFLEHALTGIQPVPFRIPEGIQMVPTDPNTGQKTNFNDRAAIYEPFIQGDMEDDENPERQPVVLESEEENYIVEEQKELKPEQLYAPEPREGRKSFEDLWKQNMEQDGDLSGDLGPQDGLY